MCLITSDWPLKSSIICWKRASFSFPWTLICSTEQAHVWRGCTCHAVLNCVYSYLYFDLTLQLSCFLALQTSRVPCCLSDVEGQTHLDKCDIYYNRSGFRYNFILKLNTDIWDENRCKLSGVILCIYCFSSWIDFKIIYLISLYVL